MISDERLVKIEGLVCANLNEDSAPSKVSRLAYIHYFDDDLTIYAGRDWRRKRSRLCSQGLLCPYATYYLDLTKTFQANCNRLLDVARETYKENVGDIYQLNRNISETHSLPISLQYQDTGFVFTLKKTDLEGELPQGFVNVSLKKGKWVFSSMELVSYLCGLTQRKRLTISCLY